MRNVIFLFVIIFLSISQIAKGQTACNTELIIGEWKSMGMIHWGEPTNIDSLRIIAKDNVSVGTVQFKSDSTCKWNLSYRKRAYLLYYYFDHDKCELIFSRSKKRLKKEKLKEKSNWEIIFIDEEILIYKEDNNPKSVATHVLLRN